MKKTILILVFISFFFIGLGQISKTVTISAGGLQNALSPKEKGSITDLILKGTINATDFQIIRKQFPKLTNLDLSDVQIVACTTKYSSLDGITITNYSENTIPNGAFHNTYLEQPVPDNDSSLLVSIILPSSISEIGSEAFRGCTALTSITIPSSVKILGSGIFYQCSSLKSIFLPNSLNSIPDHTFSGCKSLVSINLPSSISEIGSFAFNGCTSLISISIPSSVTKLKNHLFSQCNALTIINLPNSITSIGVEAFSRCSALKTINLPNSVTTIEDAAFAECSSLISFTIPSSVITIGASAFLECRNLSTIYSYPVIPIEVAYEIFSGNANTCILRVPFGSEKAYRTVRPWKDFKHIMIISKSK